jgi:hypothetical protein
MWRLLHPALRFVIGWGGLAAAVVAALYRGPRKMFETWDWYVYRFHDKAVFEAVDSGKWSAPLLMRVGGRDEVVGQPSRIPLTTQEISVKLGRGDSSVSRSLERLKSAKKICNKLARWMPTEP